MFDYIAKMRSGVRRYYRRRAMIRELSALDDRMLKDLGISRSQIVPIAMGKDHRNE